LGVGFEPTCGFPRTFKESSLRQFAYPKICLSINLNKSSFTI